MSHTPPSTNPGPPPRNRYWWVLAAVAVIVVLYFVFFPAQEAETPTVDGDDNAVVEPGTPAAGGGAGTAPGAAPAE